MGGVMHLLDEDDPPDALCEACGDGLDMTDIDVEAYELTGRLLCRDCADEVYCDD